MKCPCEARGEMQWDTWASDSSFGLLEEEWRSEWPNVGSRSRKQRRREEEQEQEEENNKTENREKEKDAQSEEGPKMGSKTAKLVAKHFASRPSHARPIPCSDGQ